MLGRKAKAKPKANANGKGDPVQAAFDEVRRLSRKIVKLTAELEDVKTSLHDGNAERLGRLTLSLKQKRQELAEAHRVWFEAVLASQANDYRSARRELKKLKASIPPQEAELRRLDGELAAVDEQIRSERNELLHVQSDSRAIIWEPAREAIAEVITEHERNIAELSDCRSRLEEQRQAANGKLVRVRARIAALEGEVKLLVHSWRETIGDLHGSPASIRTMLYDPSCLVNRVEAERILDVWDKGLRTNGSARIYEVKRALVLYDKSSGAVIRSYVESAIAPSQATSGTRHPGCVTFNIADLKRELVSQRQAAVTA